jgi:hypothetical protein
MVPQHIVGLEAIPLMPNSKVDRKVLPAPDRNGSQLAEAPVASRDELELQLTKIWDELGLSKIIKNQVKLNFNMIGI